MKFIKYILLILLLTPSISYPMIYRIYNGTIGENKVEFYFYDDNGVFLVDKEHQVKRFSLIREPNDTFHFRTYSPDSFKETLDKIYIENFDISAFSHKKENYQYLTGYTLNGERINLHKTFEYDEIDKDTWQEAEFNNIEFLQEESSKDFYFKIMISKPKESIADITGIKIYRKHDGKLIQTITDIKECDFLSYRNIVTHKNFDFNFDGDNNDFYLVKDRYQGFNTTAEYYVFDKKQQQFVKLNLEGKDFRFDYEEKTASSHKYCPGKKENDEISLIDTFKYIGNNRYKRIETKCTYKKGGYMNDNGKYEYEQERVCKPKERTDCRNYIDNNDYDD